MARGYGVGNFGDAYYGVTKYVDASASATISASVSSNATATFVSGQPQQIDATTTITSNMVRVKSVEGIIESSTVTVSNAEVIYVSSSSLTPACSVTSQCERVRLFSGIITLQSTVSVSAREKWEPIAITAETWTPLTDTAQIWTEVA